MFFCKCIPFYPQTTDQTLESWQPEDFRFRGGLSHSCGRRTVWMWGVHKHILLCWISSFTASRSFQLLLEQSHLRSTEVCLFQGSSGGILLAAVSVGLSQRWDFLFVLKKFLCVPQPDLPSPVLTGTAHSGECAGCWEISRGREFATSFPCRCAVIQRCLLNPYRLETQSFLID